MDDQHLKSILESLDNVSKAPVRSDLEIKIIEQFISPKVESPSIILYKKHYLVAAALVVFTILNLAMFLIPEIETTNTAYNETIDQDYTIYSAYNLDRTVEYYNFNLNN